MLGYKSKQGFVVYRVRVKRGSRKKPYAKGINYGKPRNCGINKHKWRRNHRSKAEERVGRAGRGLRQRAHGASKIRPSQRAAWKKNNTLSLR